MTGSLLLIVVKESRCLVFQAIRLMLTLAVIWQSKRSLEFVKGPFAATQGRSTSLLFVLPSLSDSSGHNILPCGGCGAGILGPLMLFLMACCREKQVAWGIIPGTQAKLILLVSSTGTLHLVTRVVLNVAQQVPVLLSGCFLLGFEVPARGNA